MKKLFLGFLAALIVSVSAQAQTFTDETKFNDYIGVQTASHTSSTTGTYKAVPSTRGTMTILASSSVAGVTATLTLSTKGSSDSVNGSIVSTSALTLFTTPTVITVSGPLNFQKVKLTLNAPGAATASDTRIFSRQ